MSTTTKLISCEDKVLKTIEKRPMTFMKLVEASGCATETVEKYLSIHLNENKICQKKGKFRILHSPKLTFDELQFYELMLNPTIKSVVLVMLKSKPLSQIELVAITEKSNPSISRALRNLLDKKIVNQDLECSAKIRSTQNEISGKLKITGDSGYFLFYEPVSATSPGQACVFYKNEQVLGGGWIT